MDRTFLSQPPVASASSQTPFHIEAGTFSGSGSDSACALFAPMHYEPGYAYPLVVWLHGPGADERQLLRVMPMLSMRNYTAVAPRGTFPTQGATSAGGSGGYDWRQAEQHVALAEQRIFDGMETACAKYHVHASRVFLAGFDSGGTMALRVALAHPRRFAGVVSLGGPLPANGTLLAGLADARRMPVLLAAGHRSATHDPKSMCDDLRLLHTAGMSMTVRPYPCGQELTAQMLVDVDRWIIEQITRPRPDRA